MGAMTSQITSLATVYLSVYSGAGKRKHRSSASLAFVRGIHRWPVIPPHKWPVTRKMFPFDDVIMDIENALCGKYRHVRVSYRVLLWWCLVNVPPRRGSYFPSRSATGLLLPSTMPQKPPLSCHRQRWIRKWVRITFNNVGYALLFAKLLKLITDTCQTNIDIGWWCIEWCFGPTLHLISGFSIQRHYMVLYLINWSNLYDIIYCSHVRWNILIYLFIMGCNLKW